MGIPGQAAISRSPQRATACCQLFAVLCAEEFRAESIPWVGSSTDQQPWAGSQHHSHWTDLLQSHTVNKSSLMLPHSPFCAAVMCFTWNLWHFLTSVTTLLALRLLLTCNHLSTIAFSLKEEFKVFILGTDIYFKHQKTPTKPQNQTTQA